MDKGVEGVGIWFLSLNLAGHHSRRMNLRTTFPRTLDSFTPLLIPTAGKMDELLRVLGHLPYAVTAMATLGNGHSLDQRGISSGGMRQGQVCASSFKAQAGKGPIDDLRAFRSESEMESMRAALS